MTWFMIIGWLGSFSLLVECILVLHLDLGDLVLKLFQLELMLVARVIEAVVHLVDYFVAWFVHVRAVIVC
jgi:hypothetical protein